MSDHLSELCTAESPHTTFVVDLCKISQRNDWEFTYRPIPDENILECFLRGQRQEATSTSNGPLDTSTSTNVVEVSNRPKPSFSLIVVDNVKERFAAEPYGGFFGTQTQRRTELRRLRYTRSKQYSEILKHLQIPVKRDPMNFSIFPRRIDSNSCTASLFQANVYKLVFNIAETSFGFELVWSCSQSGTISAVLIHSSTVGTCEEVEGWIREMLRHKSILAHPMAVVLAACFGMLPMISSDDWEELGRIETDMPRYFDASHPEAMDAYSIGQLLSRVSRETSSIATRRAQLASRKAVVDIILTECDEVTRCESSSMTEDEWLRASEYIKNHARHQSRDIAQAISDVEIWQQRANNLVQNICNLIAQRDAQENLIIARDMRLQAEASKRVTEQSKKIAEATMKDSASMRAIAAVTMIYLPGSFLSVRTFLPFSISLLTRMTVAVLNRIV